MSGPNFNLLSCGITGVLSGWDTLPIGDGGYITGLDVAAVGAAAGAVCRTDTSGGYFWTGTRWRQVCTRISLGLSATDAIPASVDMWEIRVAPGNPNYVYMIWPAFGPNAGGYECVYCSADKGQTWTYKNTGVLLFHAFDPGTGLSPFQYGNTIGNAVPAKFATEKLVIDPANPLVCYVGIPFACVMDGIYAGQSPGLYRTLDGGTHWTLVPIANVPLPTELPGFAGMVIDGNYGSPTTISINDGYGAATVSKRLLIPVSGQGVYESLDGGATWAAASSDPTPSTSAIITTTVDSDILIALVLCTGQGSVLSVTNSSGDPGGSLTWTKRDLTAAGKSPLFAQGGQSFGIYEYWASTGVHHGTYHISVNYNPGNRTSIISSIPTANGTCSVPAANFSAGAGGLPGVVMTVSSGSGFAAGQGLDVTTIPGTGLSILADPTTGILPYGSLTGTGGAGTYQLDTWPYIVSGQPSHGYTKIANQVLVFAVKNADTSNPFADFGVRQASGTSCTIAPSTGGTGILTVGGTFINGNTSGHPELPQNGGFRIGMAVTDDAGGIIAAGTVITQDGISEPGLSGFGSLGTYRVNLSQTVATPEQMYSVEVGPGQNINYFSTQTANSLFFALSNGYTSTGAWASGTTYWPGQVTLGSNAVYYKCLINATIGTDPITMPAFWLVGTTYAATNQVEGSDGYTYTSIAGGNVGNNPTTDYAHTYWTQGALNPWVPTATPRLADTSGTNGSTVTCTLMGGTSDLPITYGGSNQNLWAESSSAPIAFGAHEIASQYTYQYSAAMWIDAIAGLSGSVALDGSPVYARSGPSPNKQPVQISNGQVGHDGTYWCCDFPGTYITGGGLWRYKSGVWDRADGSYGAVCSYVYAGGPAPNCGPGAPGASTWGQQVVADPRSSKTGYVTAAIFNFGSSGMQTQNGNDPIQSIVWVGGASNFGETSNLSSAIVWLNSPTGRINTIGQMVMDQTDGTYWLSSGNGVVKLNSGLDYDLRAYSVDGTVLDEGIEQTLVQFVMAAPGAPNILTGVQDEGIFSSVPPAYPTAVVFPGGDQHGWSADWAADNSQFVCAYTGGGTYANSNPQAGYSNNHGLAGSWHPFTNQPTLVGGYSGCIACSVAGSDGLTVPNTTANMVVIAGSSATTPQYTLNCATSAWLNTDLPTQSYLSYYGDVGQLLAADRVTPNKFYAYVPGQGVYRSVNGGANFTKVNTQLVNAGASAFLISAPGNPGHLWLSSSSYGGGAIPYFSTNAGTTFTAIPGVTNCSGMALGKAYPGSYPTIFLQATVSSSVGGNNTVGVWKGVCPTPFNISNMVWTQLPENPQIEGLTWLHADWNVLGRCYAGYGSGWGAEQFNP